MARHLKKAIGRVQSRNSCLQMHQTAVPQSSVASTATVAQLNQDRTTPHRTTNRVSTDKSRRQESNDVTDTMYYETVKRYDTLNF